LAYEFPCSRSGRLLRRQRLPRTEGEPPTTDQAASIVRPPPGRAPSAIRTRPRGAFSHRERACVRSLHESQRKTSHPALLAGGSFVCVFPFGPNVDTSPVKTGHVLTVKERHRQNGPTLTSSRKQGRQPASTSCRTTTVDALSGPVDDPLSVSHATISG